MRNFSANPAQALMQPTRSVPGEESQPVRLTKVNSCMCMYMCICMKPVLGRIEIFFCCSASVRLVCYPVEAPAPSLAARINVQLVVGVGAPSQKVLDFVKSCS